MTNQDTKSGGKISKSAARRVRRKKAAARREVSGALIDPDKRLWRSLGAGSGGVPSYTHSRMQRLAYELWLTNLMGQRLIEVVTDHVVGEGDLQPAFYVRFLGNPNQDVLCGIIVVILWSR